jgi:hypothetical protein
MAFFRLFFIALLTAQQKGYQGYCKLSAIQGEIK